jgi:Uma2 family endonuclease
MEALRYIPHYNLEDYQRWEGEWELIEGLPYDMSPSPKRKHQRLGNRLVHALNLVIGDSDSVCSDCEVYYELDWIISDSTVVRPDIMVVCGSFTDDFLRFPPALIVEIVSPHTAIKDNTVKHDLYAQNGVRHYIIIDPETGKIKAFRLIEGNYRESGGTDFDLADGCSLTLDMEALAKME